ncbi:hypothetical protein [Martelella mangrovi]|uniref:O-antigen ligase n=1 Tax=Martelella mangrovi TaxID=1397477 RepID=A0ABV2I6H9_9HYPH
MSGRSRHPKPRAVHQLRVKKKYLRFEAVWCFLLPLLTVIRVPLVGTLLASDLALFILIPVILTKSRRFNFRQPFLYPILSLLALWCLVSIVSDFRAHTAVTDILRSQASFWTFGGYFFVLFVLIDGKKERYTLALFGMALSMILKNVLGVSAFGADGFFGVAWKFGNGPAITIILLIYLEKQRFSRKKQGLFTMIFAFVHLALNSRSLFLNTFLAGAASFGGLRGLGTVTRTIAGISLIFLTIAIYPIAEGLYGNLVRSGALGQEVREKYIMQSQSGLGVLLGGRSESLISLKAIAEKPFLGYGSYAKDSSLRMEYFQIKESLGEDINWNSEFVHRSDLIPTHSFIFSAWVNHGLIGALFWLFILIISFRAILASVFGFRPSGPLELLCFFWLTWAIFFSPFGLTQRIFVPIYVCIACIVIMQNVRLPSRRSAQ